MHLPPTLGDILRKSVGGYLGAADFQVRQLANDVADSTGDGPQLLFNGLVEVAIFLRKVISVLVVGRQIAAFSCSRISPATIEFEAFAGKEKHVVADLDLLIEPYYIFKRLLRSAFKSNAARLSSKIVDVGCGRKPYQRFVSADEYIGLDVTPKSKADVLGDCLSLPLRDASFDGGVCMEVLEHTPKPDRCLIEINRVLTSGAPLLLSTPMMWSLHHEPHDYFRFTKYSLKMLLEANGFEVDRILRIGGVFSVVSQRLIDVTYVVLYKLLSFLPQAIRHGIPVAVLAPFQIAGYYIGRLLDRVDDKDALDWFVVSKKQ